MVDKVNPRISVCIPAYNRPGVLPALLDSIFAQDYAQYEIVISEDGSPARAEIAAIARRYAERYPEVIRYHENQKNLGYDGNLRCLIELARGDYCFFMGNDDLMYPGALTRVATALDKQADIGVVLRTYAAFSGTPENIVQTFRYFDKALFFPAGKETIVTFFRRCVVISGLVLHRAAALQYATDRFDGSLLYQLYLVANILTHMNGISLPEVLALYRTGGVPDFGNSEAEKGKFIPQAQTPESSLTFMHGMLEIAREVEKTRGVDFYSGILRDIGNYSYPILSIQARQPWRIFLHYCYGLARMGLWKNKMFYFYSLILMTLGVRRADLLIGFIKQKLGRTPVLGTVYQGKSM